MIQEDEYAIMNDAKLLPPWLRTNSEARPDALPLRTYRGGHKLPVMQASYRKAVSFGNEYLQQNGLMAWIIVDNDKRSRWLQKFEAAFALGFSRETVIPVDEQLAMKALSNSISPWHASTAIDSCTCAMQVQTGRSKDADLASIAQAINASGADLTQDTEESFGPDHCQLLVPTQSLPDDSSPSYQAGAAHSVPVRVEPAAIKCPHCGVMGQGPLVVACKECFLIACEECKTEVCSPSHFKQIALTDDTDVEQEYGTSQFSL